MDLQRRLVEVLETRMRDGRLEGLCLYSDGSREWRAPSSVQVSVRNDRTGEEIRPDDVTLAGARP